MSNNTKYAIVAVVVIAVIAIAAAFVLSDDDDDDGSSFSPSEYPAYLTVLGNADLDNDIDADDVSRIRALIDSGADREYSEVYMYDANHDGRIDSDDAEMVEAMVAAQRTGDWSSVGTVHYVNVDMDIASYDMTGNNKVITLIAPPLDTVLAVGGKDLVVGFDNRITTGKYHSEYASTFDFSKMYDVGSSNEPSTETITNASKEFGGVTVVCGTKDSYGPTMESVFEGTDVQVIRIASWEYGGTVYGLMTLGFLLKKAQESQDYYAWYSGINTAVSQIVSSLGGSISDVGAAAAYAYSDELQLLGRYSGEHVGLMSLGFYDSGDAYLNGAIGGSHGNVVTNESISAMYQNNKLRYLPLMIGAPFQIKVMSGSGDAEATAANYKAMYDTWSSKIGFDKLSGLNVCITGYSFSTGVSEVLNKLILCYWAHNEAFLSHFGCATQQEAKDVLAGYVDAYCKYIGIDGLWSFYGEDNGGKAGTIGMNLLYCGEGDERNILYGPASGSTNVDA